MALARTISTDWDTPTARTSLTKTSRPRRTRRPDVSVAAESRAGLGRASARRARFGQGARPGSELAQATRPARTGVVTAVRAEARGVASRTPNGLCVDVAASRATGTVLLEIFTRDPKRDGTWGVARSRHMPREWLHQIPDADDRHILASLAGAAVAYDRTGAEGHAYRSPYAVAGGFYDQSVSVRYRVPDALAELVLPLLCRTGRCRLRLQPTTRRRGGRP